MADILRNWSLGDYFKGESISLSFEFLTSILQIPMEQIAVTVFSGDEIISRDDETANIWKSKGLTDNQIFFYGRDENWWGPIGHLLNGALREVLGDGIFQRGSNITEERLRFDFSFDRKLTADELNEVSRIVNEAIDKSIDVICEEMTLSEARESNAIGIFDNKYGNRVKVYTVPGYSKEICGGPHASNTNELGKFIILKEEASSAGVRRIKAKIVH